MKLHFFAHVTGFLGSNFKLIQNLKKVAEALGVALDEFTIHSCVHDALSGHPGRSSSDTALGFAANLGQGQKRQ